MCRQPGAGRINIHDKHRFTQQKKVAHSLGCSELHQAFAWLAHLLSAVALYTTNRKCPTVEIAGYIESYLEESLMYRSQVVTEYTYNFWGVTDVLCLF